MRKRIAWILLLACALALVGGLIQLTREVVRLHEAQARAAEEAVVRLALWRMDSWVAQRLAAEAARPYFEYQAFYPQQAAYDAMLRPIVPGEVFTPSPLLSFESELFLLHFQLMPDGSVRSPQAPEGNLRDLAEAMEVDHQRINTKGALLEQVAEILGARDARVSHVAASCSLEVARLERSSQTLESGSGIQQMGNAIGQTGEVQQKWISEREQARRAQSYGQAQRAAPVDHNLLDPESAVNRKTRMADSEMTAAEPPPRVEIGPLVPIWPDESGAPEQASELILLARRVAVGEAEHFQGIALSSGALQEGLRGEIDDLFPSARLEMVASRSEAQKRAGHVLAAVPLALAVEWAPYEWQAVPTVLTTVTAVWLLAAVTLAGAAIAIRASLLAAERRSRFASAVTHELRTPLTTFRMYSEMLAEGMVTEEEAKRTYLRTLREEADRLTVLVENVLAFARLERGRERFHPRPVSLGSLVDESLPGLARRAAAAGFRIDVSWEAPRSDVVSTDVEVVRQILFNLVDNACKYAAGEESRVIELAVLRKDGAVHIEVRDHGPGVAPADERKIFQPFDRGRRADDGTPGIGLGLALARGLARRSGGDVRLVRRQGYGACFVLVMSP